MNMSGAFKHAAAWMLLVCACGSESQPGTLTISPSVAELVPGQTVQLVAKDETGQTVSAAWSSSDAAKVTVTSSGVVEGVAVGLARVTASADGRSATATATVREGGLVTAAGGSLSALGGHVTLDVPAGAVAAPTAVAITDANDPPLDPRVVGGTEVTVSIGGSFAQPATLSLAYDPARGPLGLPPGRLHLASLAGGEWNDLAASEDDPTARRAQAAIATSGTYSVRQAEPTALCTASEHRQFDFWLGRWDAVFVGQGPATSEITRDEEGCDIYEHFLGGGTIGLSVSFFNPDTGKWYQTYVDNAGGRILLAGSLVTGRMILATAGSSTFDRITWSMNGSGVRQLGESTVNGGTTWTTTFDGIYTRAP
jgi:Big-like domain-containing protein